MSQQMSMELLSECWKIEAVFYSASGEENVIVEGRLCEDTLLILLLHFWRRICSRFEVKIELISESCSRLNDSNEIDDAMLNSLERPTRPET